jgi:hypothetical protein
VIVHFQTPPPPQHLKHDVKQIVNLNYTSLTKFGDIGSAYPKLVILVAIGLQKPYAKLESGANLVLV